MTRITFDLDALRSFVVGIELGGFARAADRLGRSTSAVSAQLKKLEGQAGAPILRKSGRGLALTPTGETLLAYARRLIELNDEAVSAARGVELEGWVRIGLQEDFGETLLPEALGRFARAHPRVRVEARVERNAALIDGVISGKLDIALAWDSGVATPNAEQVAETAMRWIGPAGRDDVWRAASGEPLPVAAMEAPCLFFRNSYTGLIVQISCVSTPTMETMCQEILKNTDLVYISNYATRPAYLFEGVTMNLTIIIARKMQDYIPNMVFSTKYNRWNPNTRSFLFSNLAFKSR